MKKIIYYTTLLLLVASISYSQSVMDFQSGSSVVVQPGADICADQIHINGNYSGGGTICGGIAMTLNLNMLIQGFYNSVSNTMVPDTATVFLRNSVSPFLKVDSAKSVLDNSGIGSFIFFNATNGTNYYIVVKHRNSIETWSSATTAFSSGTMTYDFTTAANKAYANNMIQVNNTPVKFAIYGGDVTQNGFVDLADIILVFNNASNFIAGYVQTDVNGDNVTDLKDIIITYNNSSNFVKLKRP